MNEITIREIEKAVEGRLFGSCAEEKIFGVCTDSRNAEPGQLFVPIIGEVHDAHKFLPQVYQRGCRTFFIAHEELAAVYPDCNVILVEDTTKALQKLSSWYLKKLKLKTVAVTGSVGKTTTRDMVYAILKKKYRTGTTVGNFNNDIGVPLTIFSFDNTLEAAVLEIGMDHFGEIHRLVDIIRPDIGIITNAGVSHIENLGSREGILKAKMEITDYFGTENSLIINQDCDMLCKVKDGKDYRLIRVGTGSDCAYQVSGLVDRGGDGVSYKLTAEGETFVVDLNIPGAHNGLNSALAIAACRALDVEIGQAVQALSEIQLTGKRLTVLEKNGIKIIDDTYNAAPDSMKSAIKTLMHTEGKRKIAILAGMNELGEASREYHRQVGAFAREQRVDMLITVGEKAADIKEGFGETGLHLETKEQLFPHLRNLIQAGDVILIKGSRTMEMEQVTEWILKEQE